MVRVFESCPRLKQALLLSLLLTALSWALSAGGRPLRHISMLIVDGAQR